MRTLNDYFITAEIEDVSTASSTFVAVPDGGKVVKIITALSRCYFRWRCSNHF
jgi:serine protease inhibitor ecotin